MNKEDEESLRSHVRASVRGGFEPLEKVAESGVEYMVGTVDVPLGLAEQFVAEELEELRAEQEKWPAKTDNDRLDEAFDQLDKKGIYAQQDYWCCQTCGHAAASDEVKKSKGRYYGYVFYHNQDTEAAVDGYGVCLAFGTPTDDASKDVAVAQEAVDALRAQGLAVEWDGTVGRRPTVELTWQKRRP